MLNTLYTYLPPDRLRALARGEAMPDRAFGAVLFADISGFTPLTEKLTREMGPRRGVEELSTHLNRAYDALISALEQYGGSVIGFAGDAMTCWFDENAPGGQFASSAVAAAFAMQAAMQSFPDLALKVAIVSGPVRRWVAGNPQVQQLDILAGTTLTRVSVAEHLARRGETLADQATLQILGNHVQVSAFRQAAEDGEAFGVLAELLIQPAVVSAARPNEAIVLSLNELRPWLIPAVYEREQAGVGTFLTELRTAVALFARFDGIDYDEDPAAGQKLDRFIRLAQEIIVRNGGTLLALVMGDKGSYLYAAFGAPVAYEDDARRALKTALELRTATARLEFLAPLQLGLTQGVMRTGAYGGSSRRTYSALGDEVNLASRLMLAAAPGEIVVSARLQGLAAGHFVWKLLPPLMVKGKSQPVEAFLLQAEQSHRAIRLQEPVYELPMVGRQAELELIRQKMTRVESGQGQIIGIVAEAGMGKSRLVAEVIRMARAAGFAGYGGACQSDGRNTPYLPWKPIWNALLDDLDLPALVPDRADALPLLNSLLDAPIPENGFTENLAPQLRKSTLHALLLDLLRALTQSTPTLLVLEDWHWVDVLSQELFEDLMYGLQSLPVLVVLAYRPSDRGGRDAWAFESSPSFSRISLAELSTAESEQAIRAKLARLFPHDAESNLPPDLLPRLIQRAQGNPFFLEELLNYLRDQTPRLTRLDATLLDNLPDSLHALILSRIDQLTEREKSTLKVASVIGRVFRADWLSGYYPALGLVHDIRGDLQELSRLDITLLEAPDPELTYLFKHIVTREVAYESLSYATRTQLHEQFACYLESVTADQPDAYLDLLAYHYDLSENLPKRIEYLTRAGHAAAARFANSDAVNYFTRALQLLPPDAYQERFDLLVAREKILNVTGQRDAQLQDVHSLENLASLTSNPEWKALAASRHAWYLYGISDLAACEVVAEQAARLAEAAGRYDLQAQTYYTWGSALYHMSRYEQMLQLADRLIALAHQINAPEFEFYGNQFKGSVYEEQGNYPLARSFYEQGLKFALTTGDLIVEQEALFGLGWVTWSVRDYARSLELFERSSATARKTGDRLGEGNSLSGLGTVAWSLGDLPGAWEFHRQMIKIYAESANPAGESLTTSTLGWLAWLEGDLSRARTYLDRALILIREVGRLREEGLGLWRLGHVALSQGQIDVAETCYRKSAEIRQGLGHPAHLMESRAGLLRIAVARHQAGDQQAIPTATSLIDETYQFLETHIPEGAEAPFWMYLSLYLSLDAANDPRAEAFLEKTGRILADHALMIPDPAVRQRFLTNLPYHAQLLDILQAKRKWPL